MGFRFLLLFAAAALLGVPAAAQAAFPHTVTAGESLYSVAASDGLSVAQLAAANGISPDSQLITGSTLLIPPQTQAGSEASSSASGGSSESGASSGRGRVRGGSGDDTSGGDGSYVVQPGDTLSAIAERAGTTVEALAAANGLDPGGLLVSGRALRLTTGSGSASAGAASAATQPVGTSAEGNPAAPPYPTPERVSASEVGQIASASGVPPALAEAIGWQESGFNNDLVSVSDARGVMQILPGTWEWIQRSLTAGSPLAPASAADNVRGGVLLLHSLLNSTGDSAAMAAAGYYQGLSSVQQHGLYSDTQQYVHDVMALSRQFGGG